MEQKLAVISDVHGNYKALEAVLAFLRKERVDGIIGLGDYVTDAPYPQKVMELLYRMQEEFPCYLLRGNREEYLLDNQKADQHWKEGSSADGLLYYTAKKLTQKDLEFFDAMAADGLLVWKDGRVQLQQEKESNERAKQQGKWKDEKRQLSQENFAAKKEQGGTGALQRESPEEMDNALEEDSGNKASIPALRLCHGTPGLVRGNVDLDKKLQKQVMEQLDTEYLLGGHSHKQEIYRQDGKLYVNPGSLGLALDGKGGHAHFAILTLRGDAGKDKVSQNLAASNGEGLQNAQNNPTFTDRADLQNHQELQKLYWEPHLYDIPYDMEAYLADFRDAELTREGRILAASVEKTIRTGVNWFYLTILKVKELSGGLPLPQTSEQVWEQAAVDLDIALPTIK